MPWNAPPPSPPQGAAAAEIKQRLRAAGQRALAEANARCAARDRAAEQSPPEIQGRGGLDPVRYGDWEVNGAATDF